MTYSEVNPFLDTFSSLATCTSVQKCPTPEMHVSLPWVWPPLIPTFTSINHLLFFPPMCSTHGFIAATPRKCQAASSYWT